jgi:hypothetical protein
MLIINKRLLIGTIRNRCLIITTPILSDDMLLLAQGPGPLTEATKAEELVQY